MDLGQSVSIKGLSKVIMEMVFFKIEFSGSRDPLIKRDPPDDSDLGCWY